jgi:hypothetical protein
MRFAIALFLCTMLMACSSTYYQVRDPGSGSTYYTTDIEDEDGGAVSLKDARTNAHVTIQNSEVMELTGDQYDAAIRTITAPPEAAPASAEPTDSQPAE